MAVSALRKLDKDSSAKPPKQALGITTFVRDVEIATTAEIARLLDGQSKICNRLYNDLLDGRPAVSDIPMASLEVRNLRDFTVFLPTTTTSPRDSVTLAHELGHLLLHFPMLQKRHPGTTMVAKTWAPESEAEEERRADLEANWFAYAFLMPQRAFRHQWVLLEGDVHKMSSAWRLGEQAISLRAHSLSLTEGLPSLPAIAHDPHTAAAKARAQTP